MLGLLGLVCGSIGSYRYKTYNGLQKYIFLTNLRHIHTTSLHIPQSSATLYNSLVAISGHTLSNLLAKNEVLLLVLGGSSGVEDVA